MEGYEILKEIIAVSIKVSTTTSNRVGIDYFSGTNVLVIKIEFNGPHNQFSDGLTKTWSVKVANVDMLKVVINELKVLEVPDVEDDFLG